MRKKPEERIGSGRRAYQDVKEHPFFNEYETI